MLRNSRIELLNEKLYVAHKIIHSHFAELLLRKDYNHEKNYKHPTWKTGPNKKNWVRKKQKLQENIRKKAHAAHVKSE